MQRRALLVAGPALALAGCAGATGTGSSGSVTAFPSGLPTPTGAPGRRLQLLRQEYAAQPGREKYTPTADEPWCADFVSWVERAAGLPLRNPNSGGWRIPGTMTLLDVLRADHQWHPSSGGYRPVAGDIAIYDGSGPFGQHTNYVLSVVGDQLTTLGGNEPGGRHITISTHTLDSSLQVLGFGHRT